MSEATGAIGDTSSSGRDGEPTLKRSVTLPQLTLYVVGSMLGAGIYGLIGKAAGAVGSAVWLAFAVSMVAALLTGLTYASLASRHPKAGGAAFIIQHAFGSPLLAYCVGLAVACSGLSSVATQSNVVANNLGPMLASLLGLESVPGSFIAVGFVLLVAGIVFRGISESILFNTICTVVEVSGLLFVIAAGISYWGDRSLIEFPDSVSGAADAATALLVFQAAILTFFAFIGFEDTLNVSEEVKDPERVVPIALILAMVIATLIYIAVAITAVSVVPWRELAASPSPLTTVMERAAPWFPPYGFTVITIFAVANSALINFLMASRLIYGMANQGLVPRVLNRVHPVRRTPHLAILLLLCVAAGLAMVGDISELAAATVLLLLSVFATMNAALVVLKLRRGEPTGNFEVPIAVPVLGSIICAAMVIVRVTQGTGVAPVIAGMLIAGSLALYAAGARGQADNKVDSA